MVFRKYIKRSIQKFCDDTTLHGFKEMYYSKSTFWKLFWLLTIFLAIVVTVVHTYKSIAQFLSQPTVTSIERLEDGKILYPPLYIVYSHWTRWIDWNKVKNLNVSKSAFLYGMSFVDRMYSESMFNTETAEIEFRNVMEKHQMRTLNDFYLALSTDYPSGVSYLPNHLITIKELNCGSLMGMLCFGVAGENVSKLFIDINFVKMEKEKFQKVAFSMDKNQHVSSSGAFTDVEYATYMKNLLKFQEIEIDESGNFGQYVSLAGLMIDDSVSNAIQISPDVDSYQIKLTANVRRWQNSRRNPCIEDGESVETSNYYECMFDNIARMRKDDCKKLPFLYAKQLRLDFPSSTCKHNITFSRNGSFPDFRENFFELMFASCECRFENNQPKPCPIKCEVWDYEILNIVKNAEATVNRNAVKQKKTKIEIYYPNAESILIMSEIDSQTWENFICSIGGLMGIWIGASLLSFIQTIYLCCFSGTSDDDNDEEPSKKVSNTDNLKQKH